VNAGDPVPLVAPPQGGEVTYVAARVRNVGSCGVKIAARLSDPISGNEIGFDARQADLMVGRDGWGRPPATGNAYFANVPLCPDYMTFDVQGRAALLSVTVTDHAGRTATASQMVVPTCTQSDPMARSLCQCICSVQPVDMGFRACGG
jgi:hypothetical protein